MITTRNALTEKRKKLNLTQQELADKVNINRAYLSNLEAGKFNPSLKTASKLAKGLDSTVEELFLYL